MSLHSTLIQGGGTPLLMHTQGEAFEYVPHGATTGTTLTGLVGPEKTVRKKTRSGWRLVRQRSFAFKTDSTSGFGGIDEPQTNALLRYGELEYGIAEVKSEQHGLITVIGQRTAVEDHAGDYAE